MYAQLGFCTGNSGDPIFIETFGSGINEIQLPNGTTTYTHVSEGVSNGPNDGFYTVSSNTSYFGWFDVEDHTPDDEDGRSLIVNADFTAGEFYKTPINGLCENTTYEFSSWLINLLPPRLCGGNGIPIDVRFEIWDNTDTTLLASGNTGEIESTLEPIWELYGLIFKTEPGQTSIILKMLNNGVGGCGNDLAIDDITFKTCGDRVKIEDTSGNVNTFLCENEVPFSTELVAIPDFEIFSTHFYQWQESIDGVNWSDIIGETNPNYITPVLNTTTYYRVLVSEDAVNLQNSFCNSFSDIYQLGVISFPDAPINNGDLFDCENTTTPLFVNVPPGVLVNWYDAPVGGNLLVSKIPFFFPDNSGTYYAEAETVLAGCLSLTRTPVTATYFEAPQVEDETLSFCENETIRLHASVANPNVVTSYLWSTGETTESIDVSSAGTYRAMVFNESCMVEKTITLNQIDNPIIETIESNGKDIIITTSNTGDFLYSIDGNIFSPSNILRNIEGGKYTIYLKEQNCAEIITIEYIHFYIPKFFTPNGDGENDFFVLGGLEYYDSSQVSIFNRYGKLVKSSRNSAFLWDGTFNNQLLQTDDYWYVIVIENQKFTGHFTLKR